MRTDNLLETPTHSVMFQSYERAYTEATGMPVTLRPVETWHLPLHGKRRKNPFYATMAEKSRTCAACLQMQEKLDSVSSLLSIFADHLSMKSNQIAAQTANAEPPVITKAKEFIHEHHYLHKTTGSNANSAQGRFPAGLPQRPAIHSTAAIKPAAEGYST